MIQIHGKNYVTVAERVQAIHENLKEDKFSITTEVLPNGGMVIVKASVVTPQGTFTGISAANPSKPIEKMSPYEVAETSAVGRALGFAGYGVVDGIATADEIIKADPQSVSVAFDQSSPDMPDVTPTSLGVCKKCGAPNTTYKSGKVGCSEYCWRTQ